MCMKKAATWLLFSFPYQPIAKKLYCCLFQLTTGRNVNYRLVRKVKYLETRADSGFGGRLTLFPMT